MKKVVIFLLLFLFPAPVFAGTCGSLSGPGCVCAPGSNDVPSIGCFAPIIANVINVLFGFVGAAAILFLLYGAMKFIVSRGDQKGLQSARNTMTYAALGTVFILLIYWIVNQVAKYFGLPDLLGSFTFYQQP